MTAAAVGETHCQALAIIVQLAVMLEEWRQRAWCSWRRRKLTIMSSWRLESCVGDCGGRGTVSTNSAVSRAGEGRPHHGFWRMWRFKLVMFVDVVEKWITKVVVVGEDSLLVWMQELASRSALGCVYASISAARIQSMQWLKLPGTAVGRVCGAGYL